MKKRVSIQKGFVYGVTAIAVFAVVTGVVLRMSSISASTNTTSSATSCLAGTTMASSPLTTYEKTTFGAKAQAYQVTTLQKRTFRYVISATQQSSIGSGGVVNVKVGIGNLNNVVYTEKDGRMVIVLPDGTKIDYFYGSPNLAVGAYWTATKAISLTSYASVIRLENRNGSGYYLQGCVSNALDMRVALASPVPSPSPSPSKTAGPSVVPSVSPSTTPDPNLLAGVRGCYYNGKAFDTYVGARSENVNFIWGNGPAVINGTADNFSSRWEGIVIPKYTDAYTFKLNYDDGARLWIGGKEYINDWNNGNPRSKETIAISMQSGVAVPIKIEYFNATGSAQIQLSWKSSKQAEQVIPAGQLKHDKSYVCAPGTVVASPSPSPVPSPSKTASVIATGSITAVPSPSATPLTATLNTALSSDGKGINFTGSAAPAGTGTPPATNYTFWWNCNSTKTSFDQLVSPSECGVPQVAGQSVVPSLNELGRRFTSKKLNLLSTQKNFATAVTGNTALLLVERNGKTAIAKDAYNFIPPTASKTAVVSVVPSTVIPSKTPIPAITVNPVISVDTKSLRDGIKADYFKGQGLLDENLVASKLVKDINFNWGNQPPTVGAPANDYSARFTSKLLAPTTGDYSIGVNHNDGVRVWVGGVLIIDQWKDWDPAKCPTGATNCVLSAQIYKSSAKIHMEAGRYYDVKVEYYDKSAKAVLKLFWKTPAASNGTIINQNVFFTSYNPSPPYHGGTGLMGSYFTGENFDAIAFNQKDRTINFNWGVNGPRTNMKDNFSVRWTGFIQPRFSENYTISVSVNDGTRLWIGDKLLIDQWHDVDNNKAATYQANIALTAGTKYPIKLESYDNTGTALTYLKWKSPSEAAGFIPTLALFPGTPAPIASPSSTSSVVSSVVPSPSPSPSVTTSPINEVTRTFESGFTAIRVPDAQLPELTSALVDKGLSLYQYGPLVYTFDAASNNYVKTWNTAITVFNHKIGYYVKNPGTTSVTVNMPLSTDPEEGTDMMVYKGWNFLANTSTTDKKLSDLIYDKRICTDTTSDIHCDAYSATVNFGNLSYGYANQGKSAYTKIFVLNNDRVVANDPNPFTTINVLDQGISNVTIPAGKSFWFYFFD